MRDFDYIASPVKLLTPEIVQMVSSIHEHKGKQELFLEANVDELKTLLEVALIQSTGASNRIEGIFTSDKRLEELVRQKTEPRNRSEQEIHTDRGHEERDVLCKDGRTERRKEGCGRRQSQRNEIEGHRHRQ